MRCYYINHDGKYVAEFCFDGELMILYCDSKKDAIAFRSFKSALNLINFINSIKSGFVGHCTIV